MDSLDITDYTDIIDCKDFMDCMDSMDCTDSMDYMDGWTQYCTDSMGCMARAAIVIGSSDGNGNDAGGGSWQRWQWQ